MIDTRRANLSTIVSSLFIFLFVYTAVSKLLDYNSFQRTLARSPLIGNSASLVAVILPVVELVVAILLFVEKWRRWGYYLAFSLMLVFTTYILYMLLFVSDLPCSCGGVLRKMSWTQHFFFNLFFTLLGLFGLNEEGKIKGKMRGNSQLA